jgi:small ligand-binding sensory domain FIST
MTVESGTNSIQWVSTLSTRPSLEAAVNEVVQSAQIALQVPADVGLIFISSAFASEYSRLMPLLQEKLPNVPLIGCSGGGVIGTSQTGRAQEIEDKPALSLTLAALPGVKVHPFHLAADELPDLDSAPDDWIDLVGVSPAAQPQFVLLADPFSARLTDLLQGLDYAYPDATKVGGLASTGAANTSNALFCNYRFYREGTVGLALSGKIVLETIVAQGCRPIGPLYRVVEGERNIVLAVEPQSEASALPLGGGAGVAQKRTPLEVLQDLIQSLNDQDRLLAQNNALFVGIAQNEFKQDLEQGDFLIRQLIGVDPRAGAIAIGDRIRPGQRIQFHLRDAEASADDLDMLLRRYQRRSGSGVSPVGALMFSCLGRGEGLYGEPDFDSHLFNRYLGMVPLSGFFCNGEIGPVGENTFLHGYTSVFGIFRQP